HEQEQFLQPVQVCSVFLLIITGCFFQAYYSYTAFVLQRFHICKNKLYLLILLVHFMKRIIIVVVACLSLPVLTYCEKHMDMIIREPAHFVDVIKENTFSFSDIVASLMTVYPVQDIGAYDNILDLMALLDTSG